MGKAQTASPARRMLGAVISYRPFKLNAAYEREVFFVATVGFAAFYFTSLASYSPLDVSPVAVSFPSTQPENLAGNIGSTLSGIALFILGLGAWLIPIPLVSSAILILKQAPSAVAKSRLVGWFLAVCCFAALAAVQIQNFEISGYELPAGGIVGTYIADLFNMWLGSIGSVIAIGTATICAIMLILRQSLLDPISKKVRTFKPTFRKPLWWDKFLHREKANDNFVPIHTSAPAIEENSEDSTELPMIASAANMFPDIPETPQETAPAIGLFSRNKKKPKTYGDYVPPPVSIFNRSQGGMTNLSRKELESTASLLIRTFEDFGIKGKIIGYQPGPVVTVFEYQPDAGIKQSKVVGLIDDIALALKVDSIFIHPVRGKRALGVQVPNTHRESVHLGDIVSDQRFIDAESPLTFAMGKSLNGTPMCSDLATMPHLLAAGATGSGKSVAVNALLCSIIMKASPDEVKMILVDPKMLELSVYEGIPHLLMPVITEPTRASLALKWSANEMERRYRLMQLACVRNIQGFNDFWEKASETKRQELRNEMGDDNIAKLPYIMLVIDELADLMMTAPKDVESSIQRLAQKARASGIHMVLATQRPSVDIITGVIKANLPCRIAFQVVSKHDSRTILDLIGAEKLLGKGDMLLQRPGVGRLDRIQGALITDEEVINLVAAVKANTKAEYDETIMEWIDEEMDRQGDSGAGSGVDGPGMDDDPKYDAAITIAQQHGVVSASFLQRHLKIGYNRAARIVEFMESQGLIGKADGAKPRKWLGPGGHVA